MNWSVESIKKELEDKLKSLTGWNNITFYGVISNILYVIAYIISKIVYYLDFVYKESSWVNMSMRESALDRCDILNYIPHRKKGGVGILQISADKSFSSSYTYQGNQIYIPKWSIFTDKNNEYSVYSTDSNIYATNYQGNIEIPVKEGIPKKFIYNAFGNDFEEIRLYSDSVDEDEIYVYLIDNDENILDTYTVVKRNKLYFENSPNKRICECYTDRDFNSVVIKFGDNIVSKSLDFGDRILVRYFETKGDEVLISSLGVIDTIDEDIVDIYGNEVTLYVRNSTPILGGMGIESLESIRYNAPNVYNTISGLNTINDYKTLLESSKVVLKSIVWSVDEEKTPDLIEDMNKVFIAGISPSTRKNLTPEEQTLINLQILKPKKSVTEIINWKSATILYPKIVINAKVLNRPLSEIRADSFKALSNIFSIENTEFNVSVYDSDVIQALKSIPAVKVVEPDLFYLESGWGFSESERVITVSKLDGDLADRVKLVDNSFELWIKRKIEGVWQEPIQIANSVGINIVGMNGFTISGGVVNIIENKISYLVNELSDVFTYGISNPPENVNLGYVVYGCYKTADGNGYYTNSLRVNNFKTITDLDGDFLFYNLSYIND